LKPGIYRRRETLCITSRYVFSAIIHTGWLLVPLLIAASLSVHAAGFPQPGPGLMPNPAKGKILYNQSCASCHGADLKGSDKGPPFLHRIYESSHHADLAFQLAVKNGSRAHHWQFGDMKPVHGLSPDDVAHVTTYVRSEQRKVGIK